MTFYPLYQEFAHLWPMLAPLESYEEEMVEWDGPTISSMSTTFSLATPPEQWSLTR